MQFAQSEVLSVVNHYRVDVGHVDSVFNNSCREQHIVVVSCEIKNVFLQLVGRHLSVTDYDSDARHESFEHLFNVIEIFDAV